jgi:hypothetical protein
MKKYSLALIFLLFNILFANALSLEKKILGTWNYNISSIIPPESVKENNTRVLITFMNGENGMPKDGWLQFKMTVKLANFNGLPQKFQKYNKRATLTLEHTKHINFKWQIKGKQLVSNVISIENYFSDFQFIPNINVGEEYFEELSNFYTRLSKPTSEEYKEMALMINSPVRFDQQDNLVLFYDNSVLVKGTNEAPTKKEISNKRYATLQYQNPNSVENPYNYTYTEDGYTYAPDETAFLYLHIWNENGNILNNTDNLSGTYYCMVDNEGMWSNMAKIRVGKAVNDELTLSTDRYFSTKLNRYLMHTNTSARFKVVQDNQDITSKGNIKILNQENKIVPINKYLSTPGTYQFAATDGASYSNTVDIDVRGRLWLNAKNITNKDFKDKGYAVVQLQAVQDKQDVTALSEFFHRKSVNEWKSLGIGVSSTTVTGKGWHYFMAIRDDFYKSYPAVIRVNDKGIWHSSPDIKIEVDADTIALGDTLNFKTTPEGATVYEGDNKIDKVHIPITPGLHIYHAQKGDLFSEPVTVYVKPDDEQE